MSAIKRVTHIMPIKLGDSVVLEMLHSKGMNGLVSLNQKSHSCTMPPMVAGPNHLKTEKISMFDSRMVKSAPSC